MRLIDICGGRTGSAGHKTAGAENGIYIGISFRIKIVMEEITA
jgi:hypothetical protein